MALDFLLNSQLLVVGKGSTGSVKLEVAQGEILHLNCSLCYRMGLCGYHEMHTGDVFIILCKQNSEMST